MTVSGFHLFSGAYNSIKIWDLGTFSCLRTLHGGGGSLYTLCVVDGRWLLSGNYDNNVDVWDVADIEKAEQVRRLTGHVGAVYSLGISGNRIFSGSYDSTIKVWSTETWQCLQTLLRHTGSVDTLAVFGHVLFSGSSDSTIKVWSESV
jgi:WD40 repeat protein